MQPQPSAPWQLGSRWSGVSHAHVHFGFVHSSLKAAAEAWVGVRDVPWGERGKAPSCCCVNREDILVSDTVQTQRATDGMRGMAPVGGRGGADG